MTSQRDNGATSAGLCRPGRISSPPREADLPCVFPSPRPDLAAQEPGVCRAYLVPENCQSNLGSITETEREKWKAGATADSGSA